MTSQVKKELENRSTTFLKKEWEKMSDLTMKLLNELNKVEEGTKQYVDIVKEMYEIYNQIEPVRIILFKKLGIE